ncbi:hypothetical protein [Nocardia sp. BMG111209]|uniref:hypothetical protein n=1 Tax=Nocardia sp. BMG111209 TaxID=1160137 RepID=UPI00039F9CC4|nr:hypothetical protein [Nocardia sp. BMG111209]
MPIPVPPVRSALDRRAALRLAGSAAVAATAASTAGCFRQQPPPAPDPLLAQELSARTDVLWAKAAATLAPDRTAALTLIATQRGDHADALRTEIDRAAGVYHDGTRPSTRTPPPTDVPGPPTPPSLAALHDQLTRSQRSAADLAVSLSGFRSGLLASISASCATHVAVLLG